MFSMNAPLTAAEVHDAIVRLRVQRPLHWDLARRLLVEVLRLRPDLLAACTPPQPPPLARRGEAPGRDELDRPPGRDELDRPLAR